MLGNCIELMFAAFYSQSRTIVRMNIDEDIRSCIDFLSKLSVNCKIKTENEITVLPAKQLKKGASIEIDSASDSLAYFLMGMSTAMNLCVKINRLTSPVDKEQLKLFSESLDNTFVFSCQGEGIIFSGFCNSEMPSFENIKNEALCSGVIFAAPFKEFDVSFETGRSLNGKYVKELISRIGLFGASPRTEESTLYISSLYEKRFVKNKIGENS